MKSAPQIFGIYGIKLSEALSKNTNHCSPGRVLLNFKNIELLDSIPSVFTGCSALMLSQNRISSLHGIYQFHSLKNLSLSYNKISNFSELKHIRGEKLESLSLEGNEISAHPNYRNIIIELFPSLKTLDSKAITTVERSNIEVGKHLSNLYLETMINLEYYADKVSKENIRLKIKLELYQRAYGTHAIFCRNEPPVEDSVISRYKSLKKCVVEERLANFDKKDLRPANLITFISSALRKDILDFEQDSSFAQLVEKLLMREIFTVYLQKKPQTSHFLQEETSFTIYPSDSVFIQILFDKFIEKCELVMQLETERENLITTKLYPLAISNIRKVSSETITHRKTPKEAWAKYLDNMSPEEYAESKKRALSEQQLLTCYQLLDKIEVIAQQKQIEKLRSSVKSEKMANQFTKINTLRDTNRRLSRNQSPFIGKKKDIKELVAQKEVEIDSEHSSNIDEDTVLFTDAQLAKPAEEVKIVKTAPQKNILPPSLHGVQDFANLKEVNLKKQKQIEALMKRIQTKRRKEQKLACKIILLEWKRVAKIRSKYRRAVRLIKSISKQVTKQVIFGSWKHFILEKKRRREARVELDYYPNPSIQNNKTTNIDAFEEIDQMNLNEIPKRDLVLQLKKQLEDQQRLLDQCLTQKKPNNSIEKKTNSTQKTKRPQSAPKRLKT